MQKIYKVVVQVDNGESQIPLCIALYPDEESAYKAHDELQLMVEYGEYYDQAKEMTNKSTTLADYMVCFYTMWVSEDFARDLFESGNLDGIGVG